MLIEKHTLHRVSSKMCACAFRQKTYVAPASWCRIFLACRIMWWLLTSINELRQIQLLELSTAVVECAYVVLRFVLKGVRGGVPFPQILEGEVCVH